VRESGGRKYLPFTAGDDEVSGSEIVYLAPWADGLTAAAVEARLMESFGEAIVRDDSGLSAELKVECDEVVVASVYIFLTDAGVEISGFAIDDHQFEILRDLEAWLDL